MLQEGVFAGWLLLIGGTALVLYLVYRLIKKAVKDALREYDEEKKRDIPRDANGPHI